MKKNICITFFLLFLYAALHAQTADEILALLQTPAVTYGQAALFVLEAADVEVPYDKTNGQDAALEATRFAIEKKWLPAKAKAGDAISLENLSLLIMKAFGLKGGPMYTLFKSAHYGYREMVYRDLIQGQSDPRMKVSGEEMLFIVSRLLYSIEDNPWGFSGERSVPVTEENIPPEDLR